MGRLELAGIDVHVTPPARMWRALWALFVEYKTTFSQEAHDGIHDMWAQIAGTAPAPSPVESGDGERPVPPPRPSRPPTFNPPIDPETGQPRRPTREEREQWALANGMAGPNDLMGGRLGAKSGSAEKVGG